MTNVRQKVTGFEASDEKSQNKKQNNKNTKVQNGNLR